MQGKRLNWMVWDEFADRLGGEDDKKATKAIDDLFEVLQEKITATVTNLKMSVQNNDKGLTLVYISQLSRWSDIADHLDWAYAEATGENDKELGREHSRTKG